MKNIALISSCRTRRTHAFFSQSSEFNIIYPNKVHNPLYLDQSEIFLNLINSNSNSLGIYRHNHNLSSFIHKDITPESDWNSLKPNKDNTCYNFNIDAFVIEVGSLKVHSCINSSFVGKVPLLNLSREDLNNKLNSLEKLCLNKPIIWISSANIKFKKNHANLISSDIDQLFDKSLRIKNRQIIDEVLISRNPLNLILVKELFKDFPSDKVFLEDKDTAHLNPETGNILGNAIADKIKSLRI
jgi:hypothetical protein